MGKKRAKDRDRQETSKEIVQAAKAPPEAAASPDPRNSEPLIPYFLNNRYYKSYSSRILAKTESLLAEVRQVLALITEKKTVSKSDLIKIYDDLFRHVHDCLALWCKFPLKYDNLALAHPIASDGNDSALTRSTVFDSASHPLLDSGYRSFELLKEVYRILPAPAASALATDFYMTQYMFNLITLRIANKTDFEEKNFPVYASASDFGYGIVKVQTDPKKMTEDQLIKILHRTPYTLIRYKDDLFHGVREDRKASAVLFSKIKKKLYDDFIVLAKADYQFICDAQTIKDIGELLGDEMDNHYINISSVILRTAQLALHLQYLLPNEEAEPLNNLFQQIYHSAIKVADLPSNEKQKILESTGRTKFTDIEVQRSKIFYHFLAFLFSKNISKHFLDDSELSDKERIIKHKIDQERTAFTKVQLARPSNMKSSDKHQLDYELFSYTLRLQNHLDPYHSTHNSYFNYRASYNRTQFVGPEQTVALNILDAAFDDISSQRKRELYYSVDYSISSPGVIRMRNTPGKADQAAFPNSYYIIVDNPTRPLVLFYNKLMKTLQEIPTTDKNIPGATHSAEQIKNALSDLLEGKDHIPLLSREQLAQVIALTHSEFHLNQTFRNYKRIFHNLYGDYLKKDLDNIPEPYNKDYELQAQIERLRLQIATIIADPSYDVKQLNYSFEDLFGKVKNNTMITADSAKSALKQTSNTLIIDREYFTLISKGLLQETLARTRSSLPLDRIYLMSLLFLNYDLQVLIADASERYQLQYEHSFEHLCTYLTYYVAYLQAIESLGIKVALAVELFSVMERIVTFELQPVGHIIKVTRSKIKELEAQRDIEAALDFAARETQTLENEHELLEMEDRQAAIALAMHNEREQSRRNIENRKSREFSQETYFPEEAAAPATNLPVLSPLETQLATFRARLLALQTRLLDHYEIELIEEYETYIKEITAVIEETPSTADTDATQKELCAALLILKVNAQISRVEIFLFLSQDCEQKIVNFVRKVTNPKNFMRAMPVNESLSVIHKRFKSCAAHMLSGNQVIKLALMALYRKGHLPLSQYKTLSSYVTSLVEKRMTTLSKCIETSLTLFLQFLARQKMLSIEARKKHPKSRQCSIRKISQPSEANSLGCKNEMPADTLQDVDMASDDEEVEVATGSELVMKPSALPVSSHAHSSTAVTEAWTDPQEENSRDFIAHTSRNATYLLVEEYKTDQAAAGDSATMRRQLAVHYYDRKTDRQKKIATVKSQKAQRKLLSVVASHEEDAALSGKALEIIEKTTRHHPTRHDPFNKEPASLSKHRRGLEADLLQTMAEHTASQEALRQASELFHEVDHFDVKCHLAKRSPSYNKEAEQAQYNALVSKMQESSQHLHISLESVADCFDHSYAADEHETSKECFTESTAFTGDVSALPEHIMQTDEIKIFYSLFYFLDKKDLSATLLGSHLLKPFYNTKSEDLDVACVGDWKKIVDHVNQYPVENLRTQHIDFANCHAIKFTYLGVKFDITCYANHEAFNFSHRRRAFTTHRMGFDLFENKFTFFHEKALSDFLAKKLRPTSPDIFRVDDRRLFIALFSPLSFSDELVQMISDEYTSERSAELLKVLFLPHFFNKTVSKIFSKDLLQLTKDRLFEIDARRIGKLSDAEIEQTPSHLMAKLFFPEDVLRILTNPSNADWLSTLCSTAKDDRDLLRKLQDLVDYKPICFSHDSGKQPNHPDRKNTVIYCSQLDHGTLRYRVALPGTATVFEGTITEQDLFVMLEGRSYKKMLLIRGSQEFNLFLTSNFTDLSHTLRGAIIATLMERGHLPLLSLLELTMECPELLHTHTAENGARQADATAPLPAAKESAERAARAGPATLFQSVDGTSKQGTDPRLCI